MARIPRKAVGPMYIRRVIPEHVKDPRAPVDKSGVLIPGVTGQIPELLIIAVKLHRHHYRWNYRSRIVEASARSGCSLNCT